MKRLAVPSLSSLSRRERLLAMAGILVMSVMALDRGVLGPWLRHTRTIHQEVQRLEEMIRNDRELIRRKPRILGQAQAYQEYLRLDQSSEPDMASLLREIETLGSRSGVSLGQVKPLGETTEEASPTFAIEVEYKGSLQEWVHFVYLLQASRSLFEVERATVARMEEGSSQVQGSLRLTSRVNHSGQAPATSAGDT
ncbi:MAG: hypothetical protein HY596_03120 [Candidatus Omnitrophica bacterium]|nr:hypothetical protein [Candidatus Omnitrophota bacterium]